MIISIARTVEWVRYWWAYFKWSRYIGYPSVYSLHSGPGVLDKESRRMIMDRWDAEHEERKPKKPLPGEVRKRHA